MCLKFPIVNQKFQLKNSNQINGLIEDMYRLAAVVTVGLEVQNCSRCENPATIHQIYSGQHLCGMHLSQSIKKRVSKALREQLVLPSNACDKDGNPAIILVCISGGKDSAVLLDMLVKIVGPRRDIELVCGCVDEGIDGYRSPSMECARQLAKHHGLRFETISYPDLGFERMDAVVEAMPLIGNNHREARGMKPCSYCGVFRRQGLNALAEKVGASWMALGHNLDDMAQSVLMNLQKGEMERIIRLAPHTKFPLDGLAPRIVPLRWIPEREIHAYAVGSNLPFHHDDCPHAPGALRQKHRAHIAEMEAENPGTMHGLLHSMDAIRELWASAENPPASWKHGHARPCTNCGEPASQPICQACLFKTWLAEVND